MSINILIFLIKLEYSKNVTKLIESATEKIDPNLSINLQKLEDNKIKIYTKAFEDAKKYG